MERIIYFTLMGATLFTLLFTACTDRTLPESNSVFLYKYCHDGVTVWRSGHGLTVGLDTNSKIIPCKEY